MRNLVAILIIGIASYGGYRWWQERAQQKQAAENVENIPPAPTPAAVAEPVKPAETAPVASAPVAEAVALMPAPKVKHTPEGVFFTLQPASVMTDSGVVGVRAGTQVKLVKDNGTSLRVSDGRQEFDLNRASVTDDLEVIGRFVKQQAAQASALAQTRAEANRNLPPPPAPSQPGVAMNAQSDAQRNIDAGQLRQRLAALSQEEAALRAKINESYAEEAKEIEARRAGRSFSKGANSQQRPAMQARIEMNQKEQGRIQEELARH